MRHVSQLCPPPPPPFSLFSFSFWSRLVRTPLVSTGSSLTLILSFQIVPRFLPASILGDWHSDFTFIAVFRVYWALGGCTLPQRSDSVGARALCSQNTESRIACYPLNWRHLSGVPRETLSNHLGLRTSFPCVICLSEVIYLSRPGPLTLPSASCRATILYHFRIQVTFHFSLFPICSVQIMESSLLKTMCGILPLILFLPINLSIFPAVPVQKEMMGL